jgi:DNA-binding CsgD family transcriptional regulator
MISAPDEDHPDTTRYDFPDMSRWVFCLIAQDGRLVGVSSNARDLLGWDASRLGTRMHDWVHSEDAQLLSVALARVAAGRPSPTARLRVCGVSGEWVQVDWHLSPLAEQSPHRSIAAIRLAHPGAEPPDQRASRLEGVLWRIALEVHAAELDGQRPLGNEVWWTEPELAGLSERQAEILRRVVAGERVPRIARALMISESTVRNHLSGIYRKFGVHSQSALMLRLMPRDG